MDEINYEFDVVSKKSKYVRKEVKTDYENLETYFPFPSMRENQPEILAMLKKCILDPKVKYIIMEAGTGVGKSPLGLTLAQASKSAYIATANKFLQDQYIRDFSDLMVDLKGRSNYKCNVFEVPEGLEDKIGEFYNCSNSPCQQSKQSRATCTKDRLCDYHIQLNKATQANITSFNFASALAFLNYLPKNFQKRNLLICDEAHNIANWVTNFITIEITAKTIKELKLDTKGPSIIPDYETVEEYADFLYDIQHQTNELLDSDCVEGALVEKLEAFSKRLDLLDKITDKKADMDNFVLEKVYDIENRERKLIRLSFKPVVISKIVKDYFFRHADKILLMSATIADFPTFMDMLNINPSESAILRIPCSFPVENRPIYTHLAVGYINQKNLDASLPEIAKTVKQILDFYPDVKGIIHGVTYKICNYIYDELDSDRILFPRNAKEQKEIMDEHLLTLRPTFLLSPSMTEGVNLKDDASRIQIIVKMPYAYLGDPVLKARMLIYPNYYNMLTALTITQAYGRSIRSATDKCFTFILDRCFNTFIDTNHTIIQPSFLEAVQK